MGIPIQPVDLPYHVDIAQKVPMPPNRDTVSESYLKQVYTVVLNTTHDSMQPDNFADAWVKPAIESNQVTPEAVKNTVLHRYGNKVVTWSSNKDSTVQALDNGYHVLHPRSVSPQEMENIKNLGEVKGALETFGRDEDPGVEIDISSDPVKQDFAKWVVGLGQRAHRNITTKFVQNQDTKFTASCTMNSFNPVMTFNVNAIPEDFFAARGQPQLQLVIHELAHADSASEMSHGPKWGEACARIGAILALPGPDDPDQDLFTSMA